MRFRNLKNEGVFYCATYGENNFTDVLADWFELGGESFRPNHNFTMQNGEQILKTAFTNIEAKFYQDSLHITNIDDLVDYFLSLVSLKAIIDLPSERIHDILTQHSCDGKIELPKEYGMFICR